MIHLGLRDQLDPLNTWTQKVQPTQEHTFRRPTTSSMNEAFAIAFHRFIPHSKFFNETEGYIANGTCCLEISFSDPSFQNSTAQASVPHPFAENPPIKFLLLFSGLIYRVTENAQTSEKTLFPKLKLTKDLN